MARAMKRSKKKARPAAKPAPKRSGAKRQKPIELWYWPTPNGFKISIMLEE